MQLRQGDKVPLWATAFDGDTTLTIDVLVCDAAGNIVFDEELRHKREGLYTNEDLVMPDTPFVIAVYIPFKDGEESRVHERGSDLFMLNSPDPVILSQLQELEDSLLESETVTRASVSSIVKGSEELIREMVLEAFDKHAPLEENFIHGQIVDEQSDGFIEGKICDQ